MGKHCFPYNICAAATVNGQNERRDFLITASIGNATETVFIEVRGGFMHVAIVASAEAFELVHITCSYLNYKPRLSQTERIVGHSHRVRILILTLV